MNLIAPLLTPAQTLINQGFSSKKKLFEFTANLFEQEAGLKPSLVFNNLIERERLGSTALGSGIAIPHGRIKGLKEATGALIRLDPGIDFDAPDNLPVTLCFTLLVPDTAHEKHLMILGELAQMFGDDAMRTRLLTCPDATSLYEAVCAWSS
jgi:PTS system nitrogen regulatory IIA component